jgi:hypothetical protein
MMPSIAHAILYFVYRDEWLKYTEDAMLCQGGSRKSARKKQMAYDKNSQLILMDEQADSVWVYAI